MKSTLALNSTALLGAVLKRSYKCSNPTKIPHKLSKYVLMIAPVHRVWPLSRCNEGNHLNPKSTIPLNLPFETWAALVSDHESWVKTPEDEGEEEEERNIPARADRRGGREQRRRDDAEERVDKSGGAARLLLSAYRPESSRCSSAAEFRSEESPDTRERAEILSVPRNDTSCVQTLPLQTTCYTHTAVKRSWRRRRSVRDLSLNYSKLRRTTLHFLRSFSRFPIFSQKCRLLFSVLLGLDESITRTDMTFSYFVLSALRATYRKQGGNKTKGQSF